MHKNRPKVGPSVGTPMPRMFWLHVKRVCAAVWLVLCMVPNCVLAILCPNNSSEFRPPPLWLCRFAVFPFRFFNYLSIDGLDDVATDCPLIFVGNRSLYGVDSLVLKYLLYDRKGIWLREVVHPWHFSVPGYRYLLEVLGAVSGTYATCSKVMQKQKDCFLIYPGGLREALKSKKDPRYSLFWEKDGEFGRLASSNGYRIVPFASVGAEDMLSIWIDLPIGWLSKLLGLSGFLHHTVPLVSPFIRPQCFYFSFGKPMKVPPVFEDEEPRKRARQLDYIAKTVQNETKSAIQDLIQSGVKKQQRDRWRWWPLWWFRVLLQHPYAQWLLGY